ncbi:hypothetical protein, partial [Rhizobium leguminosarum]|uniref:hypothetical protein n=1 Tax=Rhizobium leguminosarum TaxID=384 RepID=UPI003F9A446C
GGRADFLLVGLRPTKIFESNVIARYMVVFIEAASCHAVCRPDARSLAARKRASRSSTLSIHSPT